MLNEGFLKILDNLSRYKGDEVPFEAWCKRIMINTLIDAYRKKRKQPDEVDYEEVSHSSEAVGFTLNDALKTISADDLEAMLQSLPANSRQVFNLYVIDGYTHQEIGSKMAISEGTSKWHLNHARKKLQELLKRILDPSQKMAL